MDDVITNSSIDNSSNSKYSSVRGILKGFANETTAHGIPRIIDRPNTVSKIFWSILVVIAFYVFISQTHQLVKNYYSFNTKINLINSQSVHFPAVTVCNLNKLKASSLRNSDRWKDVLQYEHEIVFVDVDASQSTNTSTPQLSPSHSKEASHTNRTEDSLERNKRNDDDEDLSYDWYYDSIEDVETAVNNESLHRRRGYTVREPPQIPAPANQELTDMGHRAEDLILECKFNNRKCDHTYFSRIQNQEYGNCYTFNGDEVGTSFQRISKAGSKFGLHLILFVETSEYLGALTEEVGVRIMTHQGDIMPTPEDVGLSITPGYSTNIAIRQIEIKRLPYPHGDCTNGENKNYLMNNRYNYSILSCQKKCFLDKMARECNCVMNSYDDYEGIPMCDRTHRICRQGIEKWFYTDIEQCDCPAPCREFVYNTQMTFSLWPDARYYHYLKQDLLRTKNDIVYKTIEDVRAARDNLVKVKVYFQELNYELVEQVPANTVESVLGTTGGLLGLFIGFSLITVVESFILLYDVISLICKRMLFK
ncbi:epithelial sodium channel subunit alpha-like [Apostichopus japonicus]|uniref:epithelial sodium channel subunit alpha-like n=1 Tax=Stichopus japonicus TaxID=307972 RepID=UPI003AB7B824